MSIRKIQNHLSLSILTICMLIVPRAVLAQSITPEGAAELKAIFEQMLEQQQNEISAEREDPKTLNLEGEVVVEPVDTYYAVTLPSMSLLYQDGSRTDVGIVAINAVPFENEDRYKMSFSVPSPIINYDTSGKEKIRFSIGGQKAAGIWNKNIYQFEKLDATLTDTLVTASTDNSRVFIPEMKVVYDLTSEGDRWTGPMHLKASNIQIENPTTSVKITLGSVLMLMKVDQLTTEALANLNAASSEALQDFKAADGVDMRFELKDLKGSKQVAEGKSEDFALSNASIGFNVDGVLSDFALVGFNFSFDGFATNMMEGYGAELFPKSASFNVAQKNIPVNEIAKTIENMPETDNPQALMMPLMLSIPSILSEAGSFLEVKETHAKNQNYEVTLNTILRADTLAAKAATADGTLRFAGLDKVLSLLQDAINTADNPAEIKSIQNLAGGLQTLKPYGRQESDPTYGSVYLFDLNLDKAGLFTINGKDATALIGGPPVPADPSLVDPALSEPSSGPASPL